MRRFAIKTDFIASAVAILAIAVDRH